MEVGYPHGRMGCPCIANGISLQDMEVGFPHGEDGISLYYMKGYPSRIWRWDIPMGGWDVPALPLGYPCIAIGISLHCQRDIPTKGVGISPWNEKVGHPCIMHTMGYPSIVL
jgi:hypothetical protein